MQDPTSAIPEWVENLKWVFAAAMLAFAFVGPRILNPLIERFKASLPNPTPIVDRTQMAVVGGALADKDALQQLTLAINRLCECLESQLEIEMEESEEAKRRKTIKELMAEMQDREHDRDR